MLIKSLHFAIVNPEISEIAGPELSVYRCTKQILMIHQFSAEEIRFEQTRMVCSSFIHSFRSTCRNLR